MIFEDMPERDWQSVRRSPDIWLIYKRSTKTVVGMWRRQTERDSAFTGMDKSFPGQYGKASAWCRCEGDELIVAGFPGGLTIPECYKAEFEALAIAAMAGVKGEVR